MHDGLLIDSYLHSQLGLAYSVDSMDIRATCRCNSRAASKFGRPELARTWKVLGNVGSFKDKMSFDLWLRHPFGRSFVKSVIDQHVRQCDVQTAAVVSCIFQQTPPPPTMDDSTTSSIMASLVDIKRINMSRNKGKLFITMLFIGGGHFVNRMKCSSNYKLRNISDEMSIG